MVLSCCVPFCRSTANTPNVSLHTFTRNPEMRKNWVQKITRHDTEFEYNPFPLVVKAHTKICSLHFKRSDFIICSEKSRLKLDAVPSYFPWTTTSDDAKNKTSKKVYNKENINDTDSTNAEFHVKKTNVITETTMMQDNCVLDVYQSNITEDDVNICEEESAPSASCSSTGFEVETDITVQDLSCDSQDSVKLFDFRKMYFDLLIEFEDYKSEVKAEMDSLKKLLEIEKRKDITHSHIINTQPLFSIDKFKNNNKDIEYYTGFPSYDILNISLDLLFGKNRSESVNMRGTSEGKHVHHKLSQINQYFLVLIKLRHNFGYKHLGTLFNICKSTVCQIFISWINYIYIKLGSLDIWPHRNIISANSPEMFSEQYPNVIGFMDATEMFIETPSSLVKQSQTYSNYKSHNTVKGLVVTDPNGAIIFISTLFTGAISDKKLIQDSGFLSVLKNKVKKEFLLPGDTFLADKGFTIQDLTSDLHININIPVFRLSGVQFSPEEVSNTRIIARERIHVERAIGRLKTYKILSDEVRMSLMGSFNQIWTVCGLLSNFKMPLRKETNEIS